jgi:dienelactone hydrolase
LPEQQTPDVTFVNGDLFLHGYLQAPAGAGPFPAVLYNHGSEPDSRGYVPNLARVFVNQGYVFFAPFRRGQSGSPGLYSRTF